MTNILFICHGNICRSPMAEFIMKDIVEKAGVSRRFFHCVRRDERGRNRKPCIPARAAETSEARDRPLGQTRGAIAA